MHGQLTPSWIVFRKLYPQFASVEDYPDELLEIQWEQAICIVSDSAYGCPCRANMLYALVAHMLTLIANGSQDGDQGGFIQSTTIDKVSVTKAAPPAPTMFHWWLGQSPAGQQLLAMLQACSAGGYYIGGMGELAGFRRVGGVFYPGWYNGR